MQVKVTCPSRVQHVIHAALVAIRVLVLVFGYSYAQAMSDTEWLKMFGMVLATSIAINAPVTNLTWGLSQVLHRF